MRVDWRQNERFSLRVPLWIRPLDLPESAAQRAETSNISATGLCLVSDLPLDTGTPVEIFLKMPKEIMGEPSKEWCCRGRVVRVADADPIRHTRAIAVKFQYYEVLQEEAAGNENPHSLEATPGRLI